MAGNAIIQIIQPGRLIKNGVVYITDRVIFNPETNGDVQEDTYELSIKPAGRGQTQAGSVRSPAGQFERRYWGRRCGRKNGLGGYRHIRGSSNVSSMGLDLILSA